MIVSKLVILSLYMQDNVFYSAIHFFCYIIDTNNITINSSVLNGINQINPKLLLFVYNILMYISE